MKSEAALKELQDHLCGSIDGGIPKNPSTGFARMLDFYKNVRVDDVNLAEDGDMLLFQWGTYNWGNGPQFEVDLTRQLIREGAEDGDIWQLHLTYRFAPTEDLRKLGQGDRWCSLPSDLAAFELFVVEHPALKAVGSREDGQVTVVYECAG